MATTGAPGDLLRRAEALIARGGRRMLGIVGPPGGGKSTLAEALVQALGGRACRVPMDGFHLADAVLAQHGTLDRKGAPETFDAWGYLRLLQRLAAHDRADGHDVGRDGVPGEVVYAPEYHREIESAVAGAIAVPPEVPLVVTEGNYLLLDREPWTQVRDILDETWFVEVDDDVRRHLLVRRHIRFGKEPDAAVAWVERSDQANAELVAPTRARADLVVPLDLSAYAEDLAPPRR